MSVPATGARQMAHFVAPPEAFIPFPQDGVQRLCVTQSLKAKHSLTAPPKTPLFHTQQSSLELDTPYSQH